MSVRDWYPQPERPIPDRTAARAEIAADTERYLMAGGTIDRTVLSPQVRCVRNVDGHPIYVSSALHQSRLTIATPFNRKSGYGRRYPEVAK
jgi:hypothetical protein